MRNDSCTRLWLSSIDIFICISKPYASCGTLFWKDTTYDLRPRILFRSIFGSAIYREPEILFVLTSINRYLLVRCSRIRVEHMERQLANLTGLVQKALTHAPHTSPSPRDYLQVPAGRDPYARGPGTFDRFLTDLSLHCSLQRLRVVYIYIFFFSWTRLRFLFYLRKERCFLVFSRSFFFLCFHRCPSIHFSLPVYFVSLLRFRLPIRLDEK